MMRRTEDLWHVEAKDVGYEGNALIFQNLQMQQALNNTRGMMMTFNGAAFPAAWTKDSAGKTADFAKVFRKKIQAPHGVATPIAAKERSKHMWFFEMSKRELARIIGANKITDIGLFQDKDSHKVYALRIKSGDHVRNIDFFTLQKALGNLLKSNDFILEAKGDKIYFTGYGEGHGIGLCLLSASYYADKGEKAQQILSRFFPDVQLERMSN
jgi:stage II sporulation protein D